MTDHTANQQIANQHDRYLSINYGRYPVAMTEGQGVRLTDADGKQYLDLFAGFGGTLLGHCHPDLIDAVTEQAKKLWFAGNLFHTKPQNDAAQAIAEQGFDGRSFFCHSGADANEAAIKLARLFGKTNPGSAGPRYKVITTHKSFHGRTFGAMAATGQDKVRKGFEPILEGFCHVPYNDLPAIEQAIDDQTVAVMLEPIQGEGGVNVPSDDFLPSLRKLCDEKNLLLIVDEVWTGCGRTGKYFAHQHWDITPDIMTLAKGVGGGLAVGVCCAREEVAKHFDWRNYGMAVHATTLGGNCLSMAVTARIFDVLKRDNLVEKAQQLGDHAMDRFRTLASQTNLIKDVRGKGLFVGIELNPDAPGAWFKGAGDVVAKCMERGVLINAAQANVLRIAPAMVITQAQLDEGLDIVEDVIKG